MLQKCTSTKLVVVLAALTCWSLAETLPNHAERPHPAEDKCEFDSLLQNANSGKAFYNAQDDQYFSLSPCARVVQPWEGFRPRGVKVYWTGWASRRYFSLGFIDGELADEADRVPWDQVNLQEGLVYSRTALPSHVELLAESVDVAEALCTARGSFTMMELGSACGPQLGHAIALNQRFPRQLPLHLTAVEADSTKVQLLKVNLNDNGMDPNAVRILRAAVAVEDGQIEFTDGGGVGDYGTHVVSENQKFVLSNGDVRKDMTKTVPAVSLHTLLANCTVVDYMHFDIQGSEHDVIPSAIRLLNKCVRMVHVGIHSGETEKLLQTVFAKNNWKLRYLYSGSTANPDNPDGWGSSVYGRMHSQDGAASWYNTRFMNFPCTSFLGAPVS